MYNIIPIIFDQDRTLENNNIWFNKYIDKIIMYIHVKINTVYNLSLFKYNNGFIISYLLIFLVIYYLFNLLKRR